MKSELMKIKKSMEEFKNCRFSSVDFDSNVVYVENTINHGMYSIPFYVFEEGYEIHADKATVVNRPQTIKHEFLEQAEKLNSSIKNIFIFKDKEDTTGKINIFKNVIKGINLNLEYSEEKEDQNEIEFSDFQKKFEKQILNYLESKEDFIKSTELFDENDELNNSVIYSKNISKSYVEEFIKQEETLYKCADSFATYIENFEKYATKEESKEFIKKSVSKLSKRGEIPRLFLELKKEYNEDIDIAKATRELTKYLESEAPEFTYNYSPSKADMPIFLKSNGVFSSNDVMILADELNTAFSKNYTNLTPEKLDVLNKLQNRCNYMVQTQQISDHAMMDIINTFNTNFKSNQEVGFPHTMPQPTKADSNLPIIAQELAIPFGIEIGIGEK